MENTTEEERAFKAMMEYENNCILKFIYSTTKTESLKVNLGFDLISLRLDMIGMIKDGINMHPQEYMRHLGYVYTDAEPLPIGDCWMFQVTKIIEPLNKYLTICNWKF